MDARRKNNKWNNNVVVVVVVIMKHIWCFISSMLSERIRARFVPYFDGFESFCVRRENARSISVPQLTWKNCRWRKLMQRKPFRILIGGETVLHNYFSGSAAVSLDLVLMNEERDYQHTGRFSPLRNSSFHWIHCYLTYDRTRTELFILLL